MPAEPSHLPHTSTRRASRKVTNEDEIDLRRARGEISCAECRRSELIARRGCPSICPNGSLSTGQGTRFVLADTTQLHTKIAEMGQRIRQLEDALAIFQSGVSNETHPLLRDELLSIKFGPDKGRNTIESEDRSRNDSSDSIDALGTLTIGDHGQVKYFGRSAGSEAGAELDRMASGGENDSTIEVSPEVSQLSSGFPFSVPTSPEKYEEALDILFGYLPSQPRAWSLCETYIEHASWAFRPLKRDEIIDDTLSPIYKSLKERRATNFPGPHTIFPHKLAVLFLIFALGALVDLTLEPYNAEAIKYVHLSRACLSLRSIFESPEVTTVQAVVLMGAFHGLAGKRYTLDGSWSLTTLGCKLAQCIGLRAQFFSILFALTDLQETQIETVQATGRPPSIRLSYIDCEFPEDDEATIDEDGNVLKGYYQWKYEFTKEIFSTVTELTLTAEPPHYQTVLDLDRKVREKTLPPHLNVFLSPEDEHCTPSVYMRGCLLGQYRTVMFSAAIIVGAIVTRSPSSSMAPSAFIELGLACDMFEKGATHSRRARSGFAILGRLREKAFQVYSQFRSGHQSTNGVLSVGKPDYGDDELALFGGQTRVLVSKLLKKSSARQKLPSTPTTDSAAASPTDSTPDVHPSLVEYLSNIPLEHVNNPASPIQLSDSGPLSYTPQTTYELDGAYAPRNQDMQSAWTPSANFTNSPPPQQQPAVYTDNSSVLPAPNMLFGTMPIYGNYAMKDESHENLVQDLGMMMAGDSGMDQQWMSFMRESGLLENSGGLPALLTSTPTMTKKKTLSGTDLIHYDATALGEANGPEVAPSISVSTTFRAPRPLDAPIDAESFDMRNPPRHIYSRYTQQVSTRAEHILSRINHGYALTYASGLAAAYAALVFFKPKRIAIREGYHGCHATIETYKKAKDSTLQVIDLDDDYQTGDLCWLETPLNPTGEAKDIQYYADKIHKVGGSLFVDSTFAPPPLQYPFNFGADCVFHSGTKYFGGHSDLLCGVLVVKTPKEWNQLHHDRTFLGSMMGSLEAWLLLRSLRTLHLRVPRQSESATILAAWLQSISSTPNGRTFDGVPGGIVAQVWHSSLQGKDSRGFDPKQQLTGGWNPTFAILMAKPEYASHLPHLLKFFVPATSLGGVESLAEHRLQSDPSADPRLIRLSIGVEEVEDSEDVLDIFKTQLFLGEREHRHCEYTYHINKDFGPGITVEFARPMRKDTQSSDDERKKACSDPNISLKKSDHSISSDLFDRPQYRYPVVVTNIPRKIRWQELKDFGRRSGGLVAFCDLDRKHQGRGFVEYFSREDAERAILALDKTYLGGQLVRVRGRPHPYRDRSRSLSPVRRHTQSRERYEYRRSGSENRDTAMDDAMRCRRNSDDRGKSGGRSQRVVELERYSPFAEHQDRNDAPVSHHEIRNCDPKVYHDSLEAKVSRGSTQNDLASKANVWSYDHDYNYSGELVADPFEVPYPYEPAYRSYGGELEYY
ncbi:hypothetical protein H0H93_007728 [Arthromyces matolae]|nr:hypothetical protein H0H93_007728 [Arthromyces matolae]